MARSNIKRTVRLNVARVLVASGIVSNTQIDRLLGLPAYTAAGLDASSKRYGKHVLTPKTA